MSRYCPEIDDHMWVIEDGKCFCMQCGLDEEDAIEVHSMIGLESDQEDGIW